MVLLEYLQDNSCHHPVCFSHGPMTSFKNMHCPGEPFACFAFRLEEL